MDEIYFNTMYFLNIAVNMDGIYCMQLLNSILKQVSMQLFESRWIFHANFNQYCY